jgi:hypothetical protein
MYFQNEHHFFHSKIPNTRKLQRQVNATSPIKGAKFRQGFELN